MMSVRASSCQTLVGGTALVGTLVHSDSSAMAPSLNIAEQIAVASKHSHKPLQVR